MHTQATHNNCYPIIILILTELVSFSDVMDKKDDSHTDEVSNNILLALLFKTINNYFDVI